MARLKDTQWSLPEGIPSPGGGRTHQWESVHAAVLMDIRDELRRLNSLLGCPNFAAIPTTLRAIRQNTTKRRRAKRGGR